MAYMIDGRGPIANKRGEWLTNEWPSGITKYGLRVRVGRPLSFPRTYDSVRLKNEGVVGLYLADEPIPEGATEVPTPPDLTEPKAEGETDEQTR